ncbi:PIN domain-containing protein [Streptomyces sp. NPDC021020]|uniref:PIN domain-containing protein n=1 Tax=Streptomyces sp. NPDC021020 TaxID=3365109 RepID=UPI003792A4E5
MISYLIDTSAVARFFQAPDKFPEWRRLIEDGQVGLAKLNEFEVMHSAERASARPALLRRLESIFEMVLPDPDVFDMARDIQEALTAGGCHRSAGPVDLMLAATACVMDLAVIHVDKDFQAIARHWPLRQYRMDTDLP